MAALVSEEVCTVRGLLVITITSIIILVFLIFLCLVASGRLSQLLFSFVVKSKLKVSM